jgi:hypothetical protein
MLLLCVRGKGEKCEEFLSKLLTSKKTFIGVFVDALVGGCEV